MTIKEGEMRGTWRCCRQAKMQTEKKKNTRHKATERKEFERRDKEGMWYQDRR